MILLNDQLTIKTPKSKLEKIFRNSKGFLPIEIDKKITCNGLAFLVRKHQGTIYYKALLQILVNHPSINDKILVNILNRVRDSGVRNAIATSARATESVLLRLAKSRNQTIRDHAKLALLARRIDSASVDEIEQLIKQYSGDEGIDLGVRMLIVNNKQTPIEVIRSVFVNDDADFIREAAQLRLANQKA